LQVRQIPRGLDVAIVSTGELPAEALTAQLATALRTLGIHDPEVVVHPVAAIERHPQTGKTRRFIPITG
jgi:hypothetical protein